MEKYIGDDIIYEQVYRRKPGNGTPENQRNRSIFDRAFYDSFIRDFTAAMDAIPKVIVQKDKKNYEYLLSRCDEIAKLNHWRIRGVVDYHKWHSFIELVMPLAEFDSRDELGLLRDIADRVSIITFEPTEDGGGRLCIMINYFEELMTDEHRGYLKFEAMANDPVLAEMVEIEPLSPELEAMAQQMNDLLDRFEAETDFDRTTVFKALIERVAKEPDESRKTLGHMIELGERLLEATLEEQGSSQ